MLTVTFVGVSSDKFFLRKKRKMIIMNGTLFREKVRRRQLLTELFWLEYSANYLHEDVHCHTGTVENRSPWR
jgi:hypothetical protein